MPLHMINSVAFVCLRLLVIDIGWTIFLRKAAGSAATDQRAAPHCWLSQILEDPSEDETARLHCRRGSLRVPDSSKTAFAGPWATSSSADLKPRPIHGIGSAQSQVRSRNASFRRHGGLGSFLASDREGHFCRSRHC